MSKSVDLKKQIMVPRGGGPSAIIRTSLAPSLGHFLLSEGLELRGEISTCLWI